METHTAKRRGLLRAPCRPILKPYGAKWKAAMRRPAAMGCSLRRLE